VDHCNFSKNSPVKPGSQIILPSVKIIQANASAARKQASLHYLNVSVTLSRTATAKTLQAKQCQCFFLLCFIPKNYTQIMNQYYKYLIKG
jgi:hypothetical protein